jgi:hypothetical protein
MHKMWRLSEAGPHNLGLACTGDGLLLGHTSLIEHRDGRFVVRTRDEIERLLKCAYDGEPPVDRLMSGLVRVASALNANDQCGARIAAVQMQVPDLASAAVRNALAAEDSLIKYSRDEGVGAANWNPALHPRTDAPPNPGWFATTDGASHHAPNVRVAENNNPTQRFDASPGTADNWVRLLPAKRIDELGDFWNGWLTPSRRAKGQSVRKSTAIGLAMFTRSALSTLCCRKCLSRGPRGRTGNKYSNSSTTIPATIRLKPANSTINSSICSPYWEPAWLPGRGQRCPSLRAPPIILKYARVRSWSAFFRTAWSWSIAQEDGVYQILGYRKHPKGYWEEDQNQKIQFPRRAKVGDVVDRMIAILQETARAETKL